MYKRIFIISCFFFAALLSGCVSATGPSFQEVTTTPSNKSLIYIYRPDYFRGCGLRYPVFIDNQQIGLLSNRGYLYSEVGPGQHTIKVQAWGKKLLLQTANIATKSLTTISGQNYFIRVDPITDDSNSFTSITGGAGIPITIPGWVITLNSVPKTEALQDLSSLRLSN